MDDTDRIIIGNEVASYLMDVMNLFPDFPKTEVLYAAILAIAGHVYCASPTYEQGDKLLMDAINEMKQTHLEESEKQ